MRWLNAAPNEMGRDESLYTTAKVGYWFTETEEDGYQFAFLPVGKITGRAYKLPQVTREQAAQMASAAALPRTRAAAAVSSADRKNDLRCACAARAAYGIGNSTNCTCRYPHEHTATRAAAHASAAAASAAAGADASAGACAFHTLHGTAQRAVEMEEERLHKMPPWLSPLECLHPAGERSSCYRIQLLLFNIWV